MKSQILCLGLAVAVVGCGETTYYGGSSASESSPFQKEVHLPAAETGLSENSYGGPRIAQANAGGKLESDTDQAVGTDGPVANIERNIIYTANVDMVVDEIAEVKKKIRSLLEQHGGYQSNYSEQKVYRNQLKAKWVLRVPSAKFHAFLDEIDTLGQTDSLQQNSQDVTEEFVDLGRRLENKKRLEERILKLLDEKTGEIKEVLEVETQLSRVREDIERMEGRLNYLKEVTAMTTITLTAQEKDDYVPEEVAGFGTRINNTFSNSIEGVTGFFQGLVLAATAVAPWLVVFGVPLAAVVMIWRRRRRAARTRTNA